MRGLLLSLGCGAMFSIFFYWVLFPQLYPFDYMPSGPGGAILIGAPGAAFLVGMIELISGVPFSKLSEAWENLPRWKRGVYGALVVVGALGLLFGGLAIYAFSTAS